MCTTAISHSTYYQKTFLGDCLSTSANNAKQSSKESCFYTEKFIYKHTGKAPKYLRPHLQTWWHYHTILNCFQNTCSLYFYTKKKREMDTLSCCRLHISELCVLWKFVSLFDNTSEHCFSARSLRFVYVLHRLKHRS